MFGGGARMRRDVKILAATLFGCACLLYGLVYALAATTTANDLFECKAIVGPIESNFPIPQSVSEPDEKAIFCDSGGWRR